MEIFPAISEEYAIRVEFFGDENGENYEIDVLTGEIKNILNHAAIFPASHYVVSKENMERATKAIEKDWKKEYVISRAKINYWRRREFRREQISTSK